MKAYIISASSANLWINCPYYLNKIQEESLARPVSCKKEIKSVNLSDEGSVAHRLAELYLKKAFKLGEVDDDEITSLSNYVSKSVQKSITDYIALVSERAFEAKEIAVEADAELYDLFICCRIDCFIIKDDFAEIIDFKSGKGKKVEPNNYQMMIYAAAIAQRYKVDSFKLTICQPATGPAKSITLSRSDIFQKYQEIKKCIDAWKLERSECSGHYPQTPGTHCDKFMCPLRQNCAKYHVSAVKKAAEVLSKVDKISELSEGNISTLMDALLVLQKTKEYVSDEIINKFDSGKNVPGYRLLAAKKVKKIADERGIAATMIEMVNKGIIDLADAFDLKSPVQLEKSLPASIYDEFVKGSINFELTKPTLKKI